MGGRNIPYETTWYLDEASLCKTSLDERLGDPSGGIGSGSVNLGVVLSGEGTTSVSSPPSVGVNNDLPSSQTGVTHGSWLWF